MSTDHDLDIEEGPLKTTAVSDSDAIEWFARKHNLAVYPWVADHDEADGEAEGGLHICVMTPEGTICHSPQWWLAQMLDGTELGRKHLKVIRHYLETASAEGA